MVSLPIYASEGKNLLGLHFVIEFDESVLRFENADNWNYDFDTALRESNGIGGKAYLSAANFESSSILVIIKIINHCY